MNRFAIAGLFALTFAIGCGDDDGDTLTEQEAQQVVSAAFSEGFTNITSSIDPETGTGTINCPDGGTISISGNTADTSNFSAVATYDDCTADNATINGMISYAGSSNESSLNITISGSLTVSGDVTGTCSIDISVSGSASGFQLSGSVCGQDISDLQNG